MGDEGGFDPCECVWGHEMAMRRLLSLLRQSQAYCTDNECFQNVSSPNQTMDSSFLFLMLTFAFAMAMFYLRPRSQRNSALDDLAKPNNGDNGFNGTPPTPPPAAS